MDPIAQVTLFLAIVSMVVMGVSHRAANFILNISTLILGMAMHLCIPDASAIQTLAQIPLTVTTALSKFCLEGCVIIYAVCLSCHCGDQTTPRL